MATSTVTSIGSFYPKSDTGFGYGTKGVTLPPRPQTIGHVLLDAISSIKPLADFDAEFHAQCYAAETDRCDDGTSGAPSMPPGFSDPYLYPMLTSNERLRLTMLWYYTRDLPDDQDLLDRLQTKVDLLKSLIGWEFAICGLLENDIFQRIACSGLPPAMVPRRESPCSHTVQQAAGSVFFIPDMSNDWRFTGSPHVSKGGMRTYAGAQLTCRVEGGEDIALGSLCVASNTPNLTLDRSKMDLLVKFADMLTEDIIHSSRRTRAKQQEKNDALLREASAESRHDLKTDAPLRILHQVFPEAQIRILPIENGSIQLEHGGPSITYPELQVESAIWEDNDVIDELLRLNNHDRLKATHPVRAMIARINNKPLDQALVVSTSDITRIFDDIDIRLVQGCAMILRHIAQEKSLQDALLAQEHFMRGVTHQLRTPIHGILGSVDLLADVIFRRSVSDTNATSTDDIAQENLRMIKSSGRELMSTVNNIIKFNRWAESTTISDMSCISDLNNLETLILEEVSWLLPEDHLDRISIFFDNTIPVEVGIVRIDMTLLKDCLQSLLLNALQCTQQGSVIVTASVPPDFSSIIFDVQDTGCGIAEADWHRIFDAYEKANDHSTGAGLGLTLACKIASSLNGKVSLESSRLGVGSHFRAEFRNPGLACPRDRTKVAVGTVSGLPERFAVIPSDPLSPLDEHFAHFLEARGLRSTDSPAGALAVVSFTHLFDQYEKLLSLAAKSPIAVSLVPAAAGEKLATAREAHPDVLFFSGPFTSERLDEIIVEIRNTHESRKLPLTTALNWDIAFRQGSDILPRCPSSRHSSNVSRSSLPQCLLVDDNLINLRIIRMYCDKKNYPYKTAVDGLQAIDAYKAAIQETPINLVLLDLQMPKCDGIRACEEIRAIERDENLQPAVIFIVTGQDSPSDRAKSIAAGADRFFVKPLALKSLDRSIADAFSKVS